ncbi:MAG: 5-methyltetrahydropteroyltriglutamate--homocysteine methyltransferase [Candidatus Heimdallarchaeota archaeon LC_2]|nr:MAG: 5-methyltetrahydropteroyltriglutamate--homocysteine methyltransferase [Candidatus Heimdallarchaeota archaeon LC_2]
MTSIRGAVSGTHPFSELLIQSLLDYKYGRAEKSIVQEKFQIELNDLIRLQENLNFPTISTGSFGIEDLIRPFTRSLSSFKSYHDLGDLPINRWHYTNTFYRKPELVSKFPEIPEVVNSDLHSLSDNNSYSHDYIHNKDSRIILPGPYSLIKLVHTKNSVYSSLDEAIIAAGEYLAKEVESLPSNYLEIQFDEPYFVWERVSRNLRDSISTAYDLLTSKCGNRKSIINTYFGDVSNIFSFLLDLPTSGFGVDFHHSNLVKISEYSLNNKILQAGIVDAQNFIPQTDGKLDRKQNKFYSKILSSLFELDPSEIVIASTTGLDYLPREIADEKLEQISDLVKSLREIN